MYIYIWRFAKIKVPQSFKGYFRIETHGDLGIPHFKKSPYIVRNNGSGNINYFTELTRPFGHIVTPLQFPSLRYLLHVDASFMRHSRGQHLAISQPTTGESPNTFQAEASFAGWNLIVSLEKGLHIGSTSSCQFQYIFFHLRICLNYISFPYRVFSAFSPPSGFPPSPVWRLDSQAAQCPKVHLFSKLARGVEQLRRHIPANEPWDLHRIMSFKKTQIPQFVFDDPN